MKKLLFALTLLAGLAWAGLGSAQRSPQELYEGTVPAPDVFDFLSWLNVDKPLTMSGLLGKIVILDFWTYGCVNCLHVIPVLERVEKKYADEVVVIGVHSAKFETEGKLENLRQVVQRYGIHHPVVNDHDFVVWRSYGARAWPTVAIVDPRGYLVIRQSGEIPFEAFDNYLSGMIAYYDELDPDIIDRRPIELALEGAGDPGTPLLFPGKVLADAAGQRLFIADSSHNRIVIADLETYEVLDIIGSGGRGYEDGAFESARFDKPQGMALLGDSLIIADVNNHSIRSANLLTGEVSTLAGNGAMGRSGIGELGPARLKTSPLRSPWDVEVYDPEARTLHVAMAGTHQLFILDLAAERLYPSVGNGREANLNGVGLADSELAQPSGLYYDGAGKLYFADSESSTIRLADFESDLVSVVAGTTDNSLFDFGDIDGELGVNRLQHALGVEGAPNGDLFIADTYNSRIRMIPAGETATQTLFGLGGTGGFKDGDAAMAEFDEPGGISYAKGILYVADTNNHAIRAIDLERGLVDTIQFPNPETLIIDRDSLVLLGGNAAAGAHIELEPQSLAPGSGMLHLRLSLPAGFKINPLIESRLVLRSDAGWTDTTTIHEAEQDIAIGFDKSGTRLDAELTLYYCRVEAEELCYIEMTTWGIPYQVGADAETDAVVLGREIVPPEL